jgi:hypothetical protein
MSTATFTQPPSSPPSNQPFSQPFPQKFPSNQPLGQQPPAQDPYGWDDWGYGNDQVDDFGTGMGGLGGLGGGGGAYGYPGGQAASPAQPQKRLTPEERIQMIESVYEEILGRKPDTRDINYYKYSTMGEDQIKKQLLASAEHKDTMNKGREYNKLKEHTEQLETRVHMLENQIKDQVDEFRELTNLLQEKNRHLELMRANYMPKTLSNGGAFTYASENEQPPINRTIELESRTPEPLKETPLIQTSAPPPVENKLPQEQVLPIASEPTIPPTPEIIQPAVAEPGQIVFTDQSDSFVPPASIPATSDDSNNESGSNAKKLFNSLIHRIL